MTSERDTHEREPETVDPEALIEDEEIDGDWDHPEELVILAAQRLPDASGFEDDDATEAAITAICQEIDPEGNELRDWFAGAAAFDLGELVGPAGRSSLRAVCFEDTQVGEDDEVERALIVYLTMCTADDAEVLGSSFMIEVAPQHSGPQDRMRLASLLLDGLSQLEPAGLRLSLTPRFGFLARPYEPVVVGQDQRPEDRAAARAARIKAMKRSR